ncbi:MULTISPECIES: sugar ABC transporter ATP-binding protein [unclassified Shewanella]|uniref:sugar ABC transporter ATP-binding protein n=1 Tax=Shewanella TaxID=22 RepID=UPI000E8357A3|nr:MULTISPECIES: sugar ABC transporter ATP-binding protein [unclassified Shewanella]MCU8009993.1 sugar ABC transporter ATP-binding protein [Shewanella sp. SM87]MCU8057123.1 sugar ABC transporter ATP-binding protein [Shewanella sp. SM35]MCU8066061.1 sugar ABC transporter ATP-binding protein [Shewanella sp. SM34]HAY92349.1 sugar ABC transporter ATP-binding protein [Shewanella sp.]
MSLILELQNISKHYPGVKALEEVSLRLYSGEVHALLGENGAGKSTLVKVMTGAQSKDGGDIIFLGEQQHFCTPIEAQKIGISTVYQEVNLVPNLSVAQNLFLGHEPKRFGLIHFKKMYADARSVLTQFKLDIDVTAPLSQYSIAVQQLIAIARGVAMSAKVLVLDEPTASLDADEVQVLFGILKQLKQRGVAIVFITHFLDQVYQISDRITVLRNGRFIGEYLTSELPQSQLIEAMLGRSLLEQLVDKKIEDNPAKGTSAVLLSLEGVSVKGSIQAMTLTVPKGQAVGLAGLLGSGRSEVCNAVFGLDLLESGSIHLAGKKLNLSQPVDAIHAGIALCPEDRKIDGIIGPLSIRENIILALQARVGWWRSLSKARQEEIAQFFIDKLQIATPDADKPIEQLSGGNQQKVILARWLAIEPILLVLDEPTRGIDIGAHAEIIKLIRSLCDDGMSLLVASSELDELVAFSNKVVVMRDRYAVRELTGSELTSQHVMQAIAEG